MGSGKREADFVKLGVIHGGHKIYSGPADNEISCDEDTRCGYDQDDDA